MLEIEDLVFGFAVPFLILFVILWGILSALGVFDKKINLVLSVALSLIAATTEAFAIFTGYITQVAGYTAVGAFAALFIVGVAVWSISRGKGIYEEVGVTKSPSRGEKKILYKLEKVDKKIARARGTKRRILLEERKELEDKLRLERAKRKYG